MGDKIAGVVDAQKNQLALHRLGSAAERHCEDAGGWVEDGR